MFTHHFTKFLPSTLQIDFVNGEGFADTDSYEFFQKNLTEESQDWSYRIKKINVALNSEKYRCPEFSTINWKESIVVIGCSHVFGIGIDDTETISYNLSKTINRPVINLGSSGASNIHILYNNLVLKNKCENPYAVIIMWSSNDRLTYFKNLEPEISNIGAWTEKYHIKHSNLYKLWNFDDNNSLAYSLLAQQMIKFLWKDTLLLEGSFFPLVAKNLQCKFFDHLDFARDKKHYGPITHKIVADYFAEKIH